MKAFILALEDFLVHPDRIDIAMALGADFVLYLEFKGSGLSEAVTTLSRKADCFEEFDRLITQLLPQRTDDVGYVNFSGDGDLVEQMKATLQSWHIDLYDQIEEGANTFYLVS